MALENKVDYTIYREDMERSFGKLTDKEWEVFASELESAFDQQLENIASGIADNLEHLVAQDSKYDYDPEEES